MVNSFYIISMIFVSLLIIIPIIKKFGIKHTDSKNRINTIDGLRGYLAVGVFIHHFIITYYWHRTEQWVQPPQNFLNNIGQMSVVMFFMITGYLFFSKIKFKNLNVIKFFLKRFFRLAPLYYLVVFIMLFIIFYQQNFILYDDYSLLLKHILKWFLFLQSDINQYSQVTHINITKITAGVTWTLIYEWSFYIIFPILFFLIKRIKILFYILFLMAVYYSIYPTNINLIYFSLNSQFFILFFMGYFFVKIEKFQNIHFQSTLVSTINLLSIIFILIYFHTSYGIIQFILIGFVFSLIVLGNSLFGILKLTFSEILGELSYSIYLLHGLVLFIIYKLLFDTVLEIWHMPIVIVIVIVISIFTYNYIEKPMMKVGKNYDKKK